MRLAKRRYGSKTAAFLGLAGVVSIAGSWATRDSSPQTTRSDAVVLSCKPSPPVGVRLLSTGTSTFRLEVEAALAVDEAMVSIGATTAGHVLTREAVWRGALASGEKRSLDIEFIVPGDATEVWAEVGVASGAGSLLRSVSALPIGTAGTSEKAARLTTSVETGETVVEYRGEMRGAR